MLWPTACGTDEKEVMTTARRLIAGVEFEDKGRKGVFGQTGAPNGSLIKAASQAV